MSFHKLLSLETVEFLDNPFVFPAKETIRLGNLDAIRWSCKHAVSILAPSRPLVHSKPSLLVPVQIAHTHCLRVEATNLIIAIPSAYQVHKRAKGAPPQVKMVEDHIANEVTQTDVAYTETLHLIAAESERTGVLHVDFKNLELMDPLWARYIWQCTHAIDLRLLGNELTRVPWQVMGFTRLQRLNLSGNRIDRLPDLLSLSHCLRELDLADNQLPSLPISFRGMTKLEVWVGTLAIVVPCPPHIPSRTSCLPPTEA